MFFSSASAPRHQCSSCASAFGSFVDLHMHTTAVHFRFTPVEREDKDFVLA